MSTTGDPRSIPHRRSWRRKLALFAVVGLVAVVRGGAANATTEPSDEPSGDPIKVMTVTTLNAAGPTYENIANTANAYADYINARGGIAGRPLEVTVCDEQFDPAVATTCARQAVEEDMVSIVGSFTFFAESIVPVIAESEHHVVRGVLSDHAVRADEPVLVQHR